MMSLTVCFPLDTVRNHMQVHKGLARAGCSETARGGLDQPLDRLTPSRSFDYILVLCTRPGALNAHTLSGTLNARTCSH
jgi:hypothetical protein